MAKAGPNALTRGLSGMIGRVLVFRGVGNETIVQAAPVRYHSSSPVQQQLRGRFREASSYAKRQVADPVMKEAYALSVKDRKGRAAYHAALTDFLNPPQITLLDCGEYKGRKGDHIRICAVDDFRVVSVTVSIMEPNGTLVETGNVVVQISGLEWVYTATAEQAAFAGCRVIITARDIPGNEAVEEVGL